MSLLSFAEVPVAAHSAVPAAPAPGALSRLGRRGARWLAVAAAALLLPLAATAKPASDSDVRAIISKSGVETQLGGFAGSLRSTLLTQPELASKLTEAQLDTIFKAFDAAFTPQQLTTDIANELRRTLADTDARATLDWLESPIGSRITAMEDSANALAASPERMNEAQAMVERLPPRRVERYLSLIRVTGADQAGAQIAMNMSAGVIHGAAQVLEATPSDLDTVRRELAPLREQMQQALAGTYLTMFASIYRELPESELDAYIAFAESPSGKRYHDGMTAAIDAAMQAAAVDAGRRIVSATRTAKAGPGA